MGIDCTEIVGDHVPKFVFFMRIERVLSTLLFNILESFSMYAQSPHQAHQKRVNDLVNFFDSIHFDLSFSLSLTTVLKLTFQL